MIEGATNVLRSVLSLQRGERMLIVHDDIKMDIGMAFARGGKVLGASSTMYSLSKHMRPMKDVPEDLRSMFKDHGVIINTFATDPEETPFRVKLIYEEIEYNARVGHAPGITKEMMKEGPMKVDYAPIVEDAEYLMSLFDGIKSVHITAPAGTDITLDLEDRSFQTDVNINEGEFGNLPAGEIWCAPVEDGANGVIVVDGSIGDLGMLSETLALKVKGGRLEAISCENLDIANRIEELCSVDEMAGVIGELGIGLNPGARLVGNILEDEKAGGTAHIAFGNNMDMYGGGNKSKTHRDFLFKEPTFVATYKDGTDRIIINDGKVVH
jgi:leucyl aminopeptidase (aminopeptidase T)